MQELLQMADFWSKSSVSQRDKKKEKGDYLCKLSKKYVAVTKILPEARKRIFYLLLPIVRRLI